MQTFDPLSAAHCQGQDFAPSYWAATQSLPTANPAPETSEHFDVAVIGGGFSGLLSAYYLAKNYQQKVCVLEANQVGFGASARNAGFALPGSGRLGYPDYAKRWGLDVSRGIYDEFQGGVNRVRSLIDEHKIDCDAQASGYLKIAHNAQAYANLQSAARFISDNFGGESSQLLSKAELDTQFMLNHHAHGAIRYENGFGLHPLKLLLGYRDMAIKAGVTLFEQSLVSKVKHGQRHTLSVNDQEISADKLLYTGNAYNNKHSHPLIDNRYLPILSSIFVTRPLSEQELVQSGLQTHQVVMDTRRLKYYYRLLPDNRLLFGGRGAVFAKDQNKAKYLNHLKTALSACFPCLSGINHDYHWHGYIAAALDDMPHVFFEDNVGYILGYCGSGVSFSSQAAYRLAQLAMKDKVPDLPLYQQPLPRIPFPQLRRLGQLGYYHLAQVQDKFS
ncbi:MULTISPECIES: FAD-binding oxidoreductase [unclassified Pseudoalteromonas]|uniref:NAD(P)/FAD-dependent oxidoreductase n=1 Tax=unclassified Pseudoalteromonas TaxID=194690 RepID=UPI0020984CCF|nr:FAD-binding oxidoreductase [Pseudoalteromonas sp. XMcav2-N]MCO7190639.1 FAD-binding oxidoreductase [Pseudoalteromonas sp. XMcav2-N]